MNVINLKKNVQELSQYVEKVQHLAEEKLKNAPVESIFTIKRQNKVFYYKRLRKKNARKQAISKNLDEIKRLEEKLYYSNLRDEAISVQKKLNNIQDILKDSQDLEKVFFDIPEERRHLIKPYEMDFKLPSLKYKYIGKPVTSSLKTTNGERVRSKSELIIADRLKYKNVPYIYEPPIAMDDENMVWYPDFLVFNVRTGESFLWEHFGMMDNTQYVESFHSKMEKYAQGGKFLGKDIIFTTETSTHPLNTDYIDLIIEQYLL